MEFGLGFTIAFSTLTMKVSSTGDSPVPDHYYQLIKQHLTELHSPYPKTFYQLLDITWKISSDQRWETYRRIKSFIPTASS